MEGSIKKLGPLGHKEAIRGINCCVDSILRTFLSLGEGAAGELMINPKPQSLNPTLLKSHRQGNRKCVKQRDVRSQHRMQAVDTTTHDPFQVSGMGFSV